MPTSPGSGCSGLLSVSANTPADLHRNLAALVKPHPLGIDLPEKDVAEEAVQVAAVLRWLRTNPGWLLILDNVDTREGATAVQELLPHLGHGHVLVTTRLSQWGPGLETHELSVLDESSAKGFLLARTDGKRKPAAGDDARAGDLDGLALALEQAGAYVAYHRCSLEEYLADWRKQDAYLRKWFDEGLMGYPRSLAATWETTVLQLPPEARALLRLLAQLAPEPIPAGLLRTDAAGGPRASAHAGRDRELPPALGRDGPERRGDRRPAVRSPGRAGVTGSGARFVTNAI